MNPILTIASLTIREAQRRRILWIAFVMGLGFLLLFGVGLHLIFREFEEQTFRDLAEITETAANGLSMTGLYVTNFLVVIMSVLISVAAISSEIESRLIDTFITKPIGRYQIVLGKWLGFALMSAGYAVFLAGGVLVVTYLRTGFTLSLIHI